jgi:fumarate hydratase class II
MSRQRGSTHTTPKTSPLYGPETRRALENFTIGGFAMPRPFIHALGLVKACAARVNGELGVLAADLAEAIEVSAQEVAEGCHDDQFPVDVFQTGSGTSTNMNANEVIATLAGRRLGRPVHPNDHVNCGQSSNDVIPTVLHVSTCLELRTLEDALHRLAEAITRRADEHRHVAKTGRTHLMDAVPLTLEQELSGWAAQLHTDLGRLTDTGRRLLRLAQGGTAVGTGLNAHPAFAARFAEEVGRRTGLPFRPVENRFELIASQESAAELSGQLRVTSLTLLKVANDLRWMNSGPVAGLGEIRLPELQAGSSIMPGKVNPVIPEAVAMAAVQVIGLDTATSLAAQDSRFQLNTMLPLIAHNLLEQIRLLANAARSLASKAIDRFEVDKGRLQAYVEHNPMLVTALNPLIGYEHAARIARRAMEERRPVRDVAQEMTRLSDEELDRILDPLALCHPAGDSAQ